MTGGVMYDIHFKKDVKIYNSNKLFFLHCKFDGRFSFTNTNCRDDYPSESSYTSYIYLVHNNFRRFDFYSQCKDAHLFISSNKFKSNSNTAWFYLVTENVDHLYVLKNEVDYQGNFIIYNVKGKSKFEIKNNIFKAPNIHLGKTNSSCNFTMTDNKISSIVEIGFDQLKSGDVVEWNQFKKGVIDYETFKSFTLEKLGVFPLVVPPDEKESLINQYKDSLRYYNKNTYRNEVSLLGNFHNYYKEKYDKESANQVYVSLKNYESEYLKLRYKENPNFNTYFKWKINILLSNVSNYGTEPAMVITMSGKVIFFFALIYLFFPNYWDEYGKDRILNRYRFFLKYLNQNTGMHELYLENKKDELLHYEGFKNFFLQNGKDAPKLFLATALPLYKWSVTGVRGYAWLLEKIDIYKEKWSNLPSNKRLFKTLILYLVFAVTILYDLLIKTLNALMLSINTFTTLGFGEIPLKGLPRYLTIIQGLIGWFMLTLFSVSLISQLLN